MGPHLYDSEPLDAVADLSPISQNMVLKNALTRHRDDIRRIDPEVQKWEQDILKDIEQWGQAIDPHLGPTPKDAQPLAETMAKKWSNRPFGKTAIAGMVDYDSWDDLIQGVDKALGGPEIDTTSTTLGRVQPKDAFRLLVRGYVNTFVESMFLEPTITHDETVRLRGIQERFQRMIPGLSSETR